MGVGGKDGTDLHTILDIEQLVVEVLFGSIDPLTFPKQCPAHGPTKCRTPKDPDHADRIQSIRILDNMKFGTCLMPFRPFGFTNQA